MISTTTVDPAMLVHEDRVHRDVYTDPAIFQLELERIFKRSWLFVGHDSQVAHPGDFVSSKLVDQPVIMIRHIDNSVHVLFNRCPHRGTKICEQNSGNARPLRCPYHGWVFDTDGRMISSALHTDYNKSKGSESALNMSRVARTVNYRGFVFACLSHDGPDFKQALGPILPAIDNLVERSPLAEVELIPGIHKHVCPGNWKLQLENIQDAAHPPFIHAASNEAGTKGRLDEFKMRAEDVMYGNNNAGNTLGESELGTFAYGHSYLASIPIRLKVSHQAEQEYKSALIKNYGDEKTQAILNEPRHFNIIYPQIMLQSHFRTMKVLRPVSVERTEISVYVFRLKGAPEEYDNVAIQFANATNSAASIILQDDLITFANIQQGLKTSAADWIFFANGIDKDIAAGSGAYKGRGFTELPMRNQFSAWRAYMSSVVEQS